MTTIKEYIAGQKLAREKLAVAEERLKVHEDIHLEKEHKAFEQRFSLSPEDKAIYDERQARLKSEEEKRKERFNKVKASIGSTLSAFGKTAGRMIKSAPARRYHSHKAHGHTRTRRRKHY